MLFTKEEDNSTKTCWLKPKTHKQPDLLLIMPQKLAQIMLPQG